VLWRPMPRFDRYEIQGRGSHIECLNLVSSRLSTTYLPLMCDRMAAHPCTMRRLLGRRRWWRRLCARAAPWTCGTRPPTRPCTLQRVRRLTLVWKLPSLVGLVERWCLVGFPALCICKTDAACPRVCPFAIVCCPRCRPPCDLAGDQQTTGCGFLDAIDKLVQLGADLNARDITSCTPLQNAAHGTYSALAAMPPGQGAAGAGAGAGGRAGGSGAAANGHGHAHGHHAGGGGANGAAGGGASSGGQQLTASQQAAQAAMTNTAARSDGLVPVRTGLAWAALGALHLSLVDQVCMATTVWPCILLGTRICCSKGLEAADAPQADGAL